MKPVTPLRSPKVSTWRTRGLGIGERQAQHRIHAAARFRQHLLGDPAVVGPAEIDLHLLLRMHADIEHAGREQAGIVDAHRVHPALAELHVAEPARVGLLGAAQRIARHPPAHVLDEARIGRHDRAAVGLAAPAHGPLLEDIVLHEGQDFVVVLGLIVVRIHVDDQNVVELALHRLLAGVGQQPRGVQLIDRNASAAFSKEVHDLRLLTFQIPLDAQRPVQLCHMPSSNTARFAALSRPLAVTITSVAVAPPRIGSGSVSPPASTCAA